MRSSDLRRYATEIHSTSTNVPALVVNGTSSSTIGPAGVRRTPDSTPGMRLVPRDGASCPILARILPRASMTTA